MFIDFKERGKEREREGERNIDAREKHQLVASHGDQTWNLGMCPDQELDLWPFNVWDHVPTNWATPSKGW